MPPRLPALACLLALAGATWAGEATDDLEHLFRNPPDSAKPSCFWWWFNSLVDKAGITRDLEEFKAKGMGGVTLVCSGNDYGVSPMPRGPAFLSPAWRELYRHALQEASRLGLQVAVNFSGGGWCMGGAWMTPELSARWYVQSQMQVTGPTRLGEPLPVPGHRDGYTPPHQGNVGHYMTWPKEKADYRDTAVVAFREAEGGGADLGPQRAAQLPAKANRRDAPVGTPARTIMDPPLVPWTGLPTDVPLKPSEVVDLTGRIRADGTLDWDIPEGRWTIQRMGHVCIGCDVRCVLPEVGYVLEIDWLNPDAVDAMFTNLGSILLEDAGPLLGKTLTALHTDSFEDGYPNWTGRMLERFKRYRGYDPTPYLPVFAGKLVGSAEISDRFLYDYRKTVADCMADGAYGHFAQRARQHGLVIQCEAAGPSWSQSVCLDALKNLGRCGLPMGEFWHDGTLTPQGQNYVGKQTASAAHTYGHPQVSAEAFTSFQHWREAPEDLKPTADRAFCEGTNRFVFHTMTCTRPEDGKPGYEYGAGTHFNPNLTWWQLGAGPWLAYINRCQALLQSGRFVADVLYYNGDWAPNLVEPKHMDAALGKGYDYDACNAEVLLTRLTVADGRLVLPDGMSYRMLVLPERTTMPVEVMRRIKELVEAGATVVGPRPLSDPGLRDHPTCDQTVRALAAEVWGDCDGQQVTSHRHGRGRVFWNQPLRRILLDDGVEPDVESSADGIDHIHRQTGQGHVYFLANRQATAVSANLTFRVAGLRPELWDPVTGTMRDAPASTRSAGRTTIPVAFPAHGSLFVVFRSPMAADLPVPAQGTIAITRPPLALEGPWTVRFDPAWGGPAQVEFAHLEDWSRRPEPGIRFYAGTATYETTFDLPDEPAPGTRSVLSLGTVKNLASVRLNGQDLGVAWTAPWQVDTSPALRRTGNRLEIQVVNLWPNRLIGDAALPPKERITRTNVPFKATDKLLPSGLIGPVAVQTSAR